MNTPSPQPSPASGRGSEVCPGVKGHGIANVPGAWDDIGAHLGAARAVAACAADYLPSPERVTLDSINRAAYLMDSVQYLLDLVQADHDRLEQQLKTA